MTKPRRTDLGPRLLRYDLNCARCGAPFTTWTKVARYCSDRCRNAAAHARQNGVPGDWRTIPRPCRQCAKPFLPTSPNRGYCSVECSAKGLKRNLERFLAANPGAQSFWNRSRRGSDTVIGRLRKKYPDLPTVCERPGCGEGRVLECAHKPEYPRNGKWRLMPLYERHMFWMLCPTCHRVLDLGIETPEQMGLR